MSYTKITTSFKDHETVLTAAHLQHMENGIADKVREYPADALTEDVKQRFRIANVFRRDGQNWLRLIGDDLPEGGKQPDHLNLEDVYLYYLEG